MRSIKKITKQIWGFLKVRKKYWLPPLIVIFALIFTLVIFDKGAVFAPFIYSIF